MTGGGDSLSLGSVRKNIDKAFNGDVSAVGLLINSPGGSPGQSEMIANYIIYKSKETDIPVISFVEDVAASGGYWIALAGDEIFALSKSSIVGSLGVVSASFGLNDLIEKHGISRRVYTAGESKVSMDMFQKEKDEDVVKLKKLLAEIHEHFKTWVIERRGNRIINDKGELLESKLFTGEYWIASSGIDKGLVDGITTIETKLKELYGENVNIRYIKKKKSFINSLMSVSLGNRLVGDLLDKAKEEIMWNRVGM
jgi:serine protease SohB